MSSFFNYKNFLFCIPLAVGNLTICAIYISFYITAILCLIYEIVTSWRDQVRVLKVLVFVVAVLPGLTSAALLAIGIFWADNKYVNLHLNLSCVGIFMEVVVAISFGAQDCNHWQLIMLIVPGLHLYLWLCIHEYYNLLIRQSRIQPPAEIHV